LTPAPDKHRLVEETLAYYQGGNIMYKTGSWPGDTGNA